jgi:CRP/FNR family transcriptional regulator
MGEILSATVASAVQAINAAHHCSVDSLCRLAALSVRERQRLEYVTEHERSIKRDHYLFHAGGKIESLYAVNCGSLKISITDKDGREQVIGFSLRGEIVGMEAIGSGTYPCNVIALEDTTCCGIPYADLHMLIEGMPSFQHHLSQLMGHQIKRDYEQIFMLGSMTADERVGRFLLNLSARYAALGYSGSCFRLCMSRKDVGSYLGLKYETVCRVISRLNKEGITEIDGRNVRIVDFAGLSRLPGDSESYVGVERRKARQEPYIFAQRTRDLLSI